jgi:3'-5' exoribonuclease
MRDLGDVEPGQTVDRRLAVRASRGLKPYADGYLVTLELGDATGSLPAKLWLGPDEAAAREVADRLDVGTVVEVDARATRYRGQVELSLDEPPDPVPGDEVQARRFVPGPERHLGRALQRIRSRARSFADPGLREAVLAVWDDERLRERLVRAPATKGHHRARRGGLVERADDLARLAGALARAHDRLDGDLLVAAALLAPLGGLDEHEAGAAIEITDEGRLLGPVTLADRRVRELVDGADLGEERALRLRHAVLAHRGKREGSPVAPRTPEAVALRYLERLDARLARTLDAADALAEEGERAAWTSETGGYLDVAARRADAGPREPDEPTASRSPRRNGAGDAAAGTI